ncbi:MAG TPA: LPS assembly lipoprotein LptE [Rhodanobacteraceae bacterium]|jgi:LPS-assembly lipoprotein|nr:LPS assembly lipoprotein LptE [Rhodanobacteraceae bacterium]
MTSRRTVSFLLLAGTLLLLSACGYHLRGEAQLPAGMERVHVDSSDQFGPLKRNVEKALERSGAKVEPAAGDGIAEVTLGAVSLAPIVRSVSANAKVNEFTMLYHVELQITDGAGKVVLPKQVVEQSRIFTFDQTQAIGTGAEQDVIKKEMERDMTQVVMRKVQSAERKSGS